MEGYSSPFINNAKNDVTSHMDGVSSYPTNADASEATPPFLPTDSSCFSISSIREETHNTIFTKESSILAIKMALGIAFGTLDDALKFQTVKKYIAEFISTLLFVYAGVGSAIAFNKLTSDASLTPAGLVAVAVAHALALFVTVSIAANISGGHVNPAVTFGLALGGHITILRGAFYWIAQLLGSTVACLLLKLTTGGLSIPTHSVASGVSLGEGVVMEMVITFGLVYTVYATAADPKKGDVGIVAPIAIGFIVGANILAAGPFSGGSMNPARSFGPALVSFDWKDQWVYWVGPLVGGGLAGIVYGGVFIDNPTHVPLATSDY